MGPFAVRHGGRLGAAGSYRAYAKIRSDEASDLESGGSANNQHDFAQAGFRLESENTAALYLVLQGDFYSGETGVDADRHASPPWRRQPARPLDPARRQRR